MTEGLQVHLLDFAPDEEQLPVLREALLPARTLTFGEVVPSTTQVLVAGRPTEAHLTASADLQLLLIPFAGLPPITRARLRAFPHIAVHNIHHNAAITAELAIGLMTACARLLIPAHNTFRNGDWSPRYAGAATTVSLAGKTAVILGYGAVGQRIGRVCAALEMQVIGVRRKPDGVSVGVDALYRVLPSADVLFIAVPGTPETERLIGAAALALMPARGIVVNVGRANVVDEWALYHALRDGRLHAAGLDVWYQYPADEAARTHTYPASAPFWELDNVVLSPHRGGGLNNPEVEHARLSNIAHALNAAARGEPVPHPVDLQAGY